MITVVEVDPEPIKKSQRNAFLGITYRWYVWNGWDNCFTYRTYTLEEALRYAALMEWTRQRVVRRVHAKLLRNRPVTIPRRRIHL